MASTFVNGPAHIFLGVPSVGAGIISSVLSSATRAPNYLGTTEGSPSVSLDPVPLRPLYNDMAGDRPLDKSYQGRTAVISCDFTRWNEDVLASAQAANPFGGVRGFDSALDIGALMLNEGYAFPLYMAHPFAAKAAYKAAGLPSGFTFWACLVEQDSIPQGGTKPKKVRLVFQALPVLVPSPTAPASGVQVSGGALVGGTGGAGGGVGILNYGFLLYTPSVPNNLTIN